MPTHPLPHPSTLDIRTRAAWTWWTAKPPILRGPAAAVFWQRHPPLTIPQYLALRLNRLPVHVSLLATTSTSNAWQDAKGRGEDGWLEGHRMTEGQHVWSRSHRGLLFRLDPARIRRRLARTNPLRLVAEWATPDDELEDRFLASAFPEPMRWADRLIHAQQAIRHGVTGGYVVAERSAEVPPRAYRPTTAWCKRHNIPQPRLKTSAIEHHQLAVEAGLIQTWARDRTLRTIAAIRSENDTTARLRQGQGRTDGQRFAVQADLEIELVTGARTYVEVLNRNYRNDDITAKYAGLAVPVLYVASSPTVADRVARLCPRATCHHF